MQFEWLRNAQKRHAKFVGNESERFKHKIYLLSVSESTGTITVDSWFYHWNGSDVLFFCKERR